MSNTGNNRKTVKKWSSSGQFFGRVSGGCGSVVPFSPQVQCTRIRPHPIGLVLCCRVGALGSASRVPWRPKEFDPTAIMLPWNPLAAAVGTPNNLAGVGGSADSPVIGSRHPRRGTLRQAFAAMPAGLKPQRETHGSCVTVCLCAVF